MAGLSRRRFLAAVGAAAAAWRLAPADLGRVLAVSQDPATTTGITTLDRTIRMTAPSVRQYRTLAEAPGEPFVERLDVLGREPDAARVGRRRSLAYLGHLTDIHIQDPQSPARLDPMSAVDHDAFGGAMRPQDTLTVHVAAQVVEAMAAVARSPVTGAPMAAVVVTGDSADMHSSLELDWYIRTLDGGEILANSGALGVYEGVQVWPEATYAYHPEDPSGDEFGAYGFPTVPGLLARAVSEPVVSQGLPVPWYAVYGNHDTLWLGTFGIDAHLRAVAVGDRKAVTWQALTTDVMRGLATDATLIGRAFGMVTTALSSDAGFRQVTPDPARKLFEQRDFITAHLASPAVPGPVGHGFTQADLDAGRTWWTADVGTHLRLFGLDTCNQVAGADGAVPDDQFQWLAGELERAQADGRLSVIVSHHNSLTLENEAASVTGPAQTLHHADELIALLLRFPTVIAWINGHTHVNTIQAHARGDGGGFWEITAASCVDFPQQQQLIDLVDNRDGTLSLFTITLDHASDPTWTPGDLSQRGLASLSRELAANDWAETPAMRIGSPIDRNCELLLAAPFDLSAIGDAQLEQAAVTAHARLLDWQRSLRARGLA